MAFNLPFDELNRLYKESHRDRLRSMPFKKFFGEMDLSQEQKEKREQTAKDIEEFMLLAVISMYNTMEVGLSDLSDASSSITQRYDALLKRLGIPLTAFFAETHPSAVASEIVSATMNHPDDPYFFSEDRVRLIAENEANSIWNDSQYQDAVDTGKRYKTWRAILDNRTRQTHRDINGTTIPIDQYFVVGNSLMFFPREASADPEEIVNCRCTAIYS